MVAGPRLVLGGGPSSVEPLYQQQLKAASSLSSGMTHAPLQALMSKRTATADYRAAKRPREDDGEMLGSKQLNADNTARGVSHLVREHDVNVKAAEPEPEPQRGATPTSAAPSAAGTTAKTMAAQRSNGGAPTPTNATGMPHDLAAIARAAAVRMLDAGEVGALVFDRGQHFPVRPMTHTPASGIFVEAPKTARRPRFSDRWQNSGGCKGSRDMRLSAECGVRRRYGTVTIQRPGATSAKQKNKAAQLHYYEYTLLRDITKEESKRVEDRTCTVFHVLPKFARDSPVGTSSTVRSAPIVSSAVARRGEAGNSRQPEQRSKQSSFVQHESQQKQQEQEQEQQPGHWDQTQSQIHGRASNCTWGQSQQAMAMAMAMQQQQLQAHVQQQLQAHMQQQQQQQQQQHLQQVQQLQFQQAAQQHMQMQMQAQIPHTAEQLRESPVHSAPGSPTHPLVQQDHIGLQQPAPQQQQTQAQDGLLDALSLLVAVASGRNDEAAESAWHGTPPHVAS